MLLLPFYISNKLCFVIIITKNNPHPLFRLNLIHKLKWPPHCEKLLINLCSSRNNLCKSCFVVYLPKTTESVVLYFYSNIHAIGFEEKNCSYCLSSRVIQQLNLKWTQFSRLTLIFEVKCGDCITLQYKHSSVNVAEWWQRGGEAEIYGMEVSVKLHWTKRLLKNGRKKWLEIVKMGISLRSGW